MYRLQLLLLALAFLMNSCSGGNSDNEQRLRTENLELRQELDSIKNVINKSQRRIEGDTILKLKDAPVNEEGGFAGKHALTLQWISWDEPGSVTIIPAENGWYKITGRQAKNEDYLRITGRIKPVNERELEFEGEIETRVSHLNNGEPCLKTGKKIFKSTGNRQYWRLQDMINCESSSTLDYIDIYF
jgi:hypothetical protein